MKAVAAPLSASAWRRSSGRGASPHGYASGTTSQPNARAIACQRSPNSPCETASTRSPGERRFTTADSNAPVPDDVKTRTSFSVRNTSRRRACARSNTAAKSGERWWSTGSERARSTDGGTDVGPGVRSFCGRSAIAPEPTPRPLAGRSPTGAFGSVIACWNVGLFEPRIVLVRIPGANWIRSALASARHADGSVP